MPSAAEMKGNSQQYGQLEDMDGGMEAQMMEQATIDSKLKREYNRLQRICLLVSSLCGIIFIVMIVLAAALASQSGCKSDDQCPSYWSDVSNATYCRALITNAVRAT